MTPARATTAPPAGARDAIGPSRFAPRSLQRCPGEGCDCRPAVGSLPVGAIDDAAETEADAIAERVLRWAPFPAAASAGGEPALRRSCARCDEDDVVRRDAVDGPPDMAPPLVAGVLARPGSPLPTGVRADMEERFGVDFGTVRVHSDRDAGRSADAVNARAYTVGQDIVFAAGAFEPSTDAGRRLLAHELAHVLQQRGGVQRLQRGGSVTRGAGGCAPPDVLDEDGQGPKGAGRLAHIQIQSFLLPRVINEVGIPRGTKDMIDSTGCQIEGVPLGFADLYLRGGSVHEIGEIKPTRHDMSHAVDEAEHYIRRAGQSMDRFFGVGALCPGASRGRDDEQFARDVAVSRLRPTFARLTGIFPTDTVVGPFDGDRSRTLKARLHAPGAIGYWCTGGQSDTYTCGVSDAETRAYIDRFALGPAESVLDEFLREHVERRLQQVLAAKSLGEILAAAEQRFGTAIRNELRPYLGPAADQLISRASAGQIGRLIEQSIGPEARAIVVTLVRRLTAMLVAELRSLMRAALAGMVREALLALCVGVPVVALAELVERLRRSMRDTALVLAPIAVAAVAARIAQVLAAELAAMLGQLVAAIVRTLGVIGEALRVVGEILLRVLAVIALLLLVVGVVVLGVLAFLAIFDPVPGDEAALAAATVALAALIPLVGRFVLTGSTEDQPGGA